MNAKPTVGISVLTDTVVVKRLSLGFEGHCRKYNFHFYIFQNFLHISHNAIFQSAKKFILECWFFFGKSWLFPEMQTATLQLVRIAVNIGLSAFVQNNIDTTAAARANILFNVYSTSVGAFISLQVIQHPGLRWGRRIAFNES